MYYSWPWQKLCAMLGQKCETLYRSFLWAPMETDSDRTALSLLHDSTIRSRSDGMKCQFHRLLARQPQGVEHHQQILKNDLYPLPFCFFLLFPAMFNNNFDKRANPSGQLFSNDTGCPLPILTASCAFTISGEITPVTTLTKSVGWLSGSTGTMQFRRFRILSLCFGVRGNAWWLRFFMTRHLPLSTVIEHVRNILNDPAAGVRTVYPSFHGFALQRKCLWFRLAMSVTHEGCLHPNVRLQEKTSNDHNNWDPPLTSFRLLYTWGRGFFNIFLNYCM